ncbi:MAG TPA: helix-turn-helix transcriptional regulator [Blastocatellia bacterium]|nr:helix-turn-helix transcriptional regulator [Blastocatellia bacterium]
MPIEEIAQAVNLSASRLRALFRIETGLTPAEYHKQIRLEKFRELLETTNLTVSQILAELSIEDGSHFLRDFRRVYGITPLEHRRNHEEESADGQDNRFIQRISRRNQIGQ